MPVKSKKTKVRNRYFNYLVVKDENQHTIIRKRIEKGIWHNLYEFLVIETEQVEDFEYIENCINNEFFKNNSVVSIAEFNPASIIHKLTHQHLHIKFWEVHLKGTIENGIDLETLKKFPFPIVIHNFIEENM